MADTVGRAERSRIMALIRSRGNRNTELLLIDLFRTMGIRGWRRHQALFGNPDFVFRKQRIALFVDGCFWHGCAVHCRVPSDNRHYWRQKIERNRQRDRVVTRTLTAQGWKVVRIWEHELRPKNRSRCTTRLRRLINDATTLKVRDNVLMGTPPSRFMRVQVTAAP